MCRQQPGVANSTGLKESEERIESRHYPSLGLHPYSGHLNAPKPHVLNSK